MHQQKPIDLMKIVKSTKYPLDAFLFVQRGLDYTVRSVHGEIPEQSETQSRHISGQELCHGLKDFAIKEYGLLTRTVLRRWRVNCCEDFGHIVYAMVDGQLMSKRPTDSLDDFVGVYDFEFAFADELQLTENN